MIQSNSISFNTRSIFRLFVNKGIAISNKIIYRYFVQEIYKYIIIIPLLNCYISTKKKKREISNLIEERIQITLAIFFHSSLESYTRRKIKMSILKGKTTNPFPSKNYANTRFLLQQLPSNSHLFNLFSSTPKNPRTTRFQNSFTLSNPRSQ